MRKVVTIVLALAVMACLIGAQALSQSPASPAAPPAATAPAVPPTGPPPQTVHYHYHYHYHPPVAAYQYPSYNTNPFSGGPNNAYFSLPPSASTPTQANPYPQGYLPGPFAPTGFQNFNPNAPSAQGVIHVFLPTKDAVVCLNGQKMRGTGKDRKFTTPTLPANQSFQYWVTATFDQNGESVTQYRKVDVGAGEYTIADFTRPPDANPVRLPAGPVNQSEAFPAQER
jgi:uncharacterized protein (TIGR03000 family)